MKDLFNLSILSSVCAVKVSAINITENLLFAIFGKKDTDDFTISYKRNQQPRWTIYLFKVRNPISYYLSTIYLSYLCDKLFSLSQVSFSIYMLVSVIVLINLLIAMMSDTYHKVISQSDIEWKYGLSKLIRIMQK